MFAVCQHAANGKVQVFAVCYGKTHSAKILENIIKIACPAAEAHNVEPHYAGLGPPCAGCRPSAGLVVDGTAPACVWRPEVLPPPPLGSGSEVADGVERGSPRRTAARAHIPGCACNIPDFFRNVKSRKM